MTEARDWIAQRRGSVPDVLAAVLDDASKRSDDPRRGSEALLEEAIELSESRAGAWPLLGADALITYLCEHALEVEEAPESRLAEVFRLCIGGP